MIKKILFTFLFSIFVLTSFSQRLHKEIYYQTEFSKLLVEQGVSNETEVVLYDKTRCDIVTDNYAIEVDFADKWAESIGQSLHYGLMLNKKPGVLLILEDLSNDTKYLDRLEAVAEKHGIAIWIVAENLNWKKIENGN